MVNIFRCSFKKIETWLKFTLTLTNLNYRRDRDLMSRPTIYKCEAKFYITSKIIFTLWYWFCIYVTYTDMNLYACTMYNSDFFKSLSCYLQKSFCNPRPKIFLWIAEDKYTWHLTLYVITVLHDKELLAL